MEKFSYKTDGSALRYGMLLPLVMMIASVVSSCISYSDAKQNITDDLNEAIIALAAENSELWTRQDTIAALQQMHQTTHKPMIYQASDLNFRNRTLKEDAYFTLALVDGRNAAPKIHGNKIASDSIMLIPEKNIGGIAIQLQGFAECSMASVFAASDQTLPLSLFTMSILLFAGLSAFRNKAQFQSATVVADTASASLNLDEIKLTPMQKRLTRMLLDSPGRKVDKTILCTALWGNKTNAEESLYTLVRRTKAALADSGIEIVCNRGESYELRINR